MALGPQLSTKKNTTGSPTGQYGESISLIEVPSPKMALACVEVTEHQPAHCYFTNLEYLLSSAANILCLGQSIRF